jgi:hypothetical protein
MSAGLQPENIELAATAVAMAKLMDLSVRVPWTSIGLAMLPSSGSRDSPIQGFVGSIDRQGCHGHDGGAVLVESFGIEAPAQEGPPLVFAVGILSVCV